jgi:hypothetical protein
MTQTSAAGTVARTMMFEDAAWAADIIYSAQAEHDHVTSLLPTLLIGHWSRIIYEGSLALRSPNPQSPSLPWLAF